METQSSNTSTDNSTTQVIDNHPKRSNNIVFLIISVVLVFLLMLLFYYGYLKINNKSTKSISLDNKSITTTSNSPEPNDKQIILPLDLKQSKISGVGFIYKFNSKLLDIKHEANGTRLSIEEVNYPEFTISTVTEVFQRINQSSTLAKISDLKIGQKVELISFYNLQSKNWILQQVHILEATQSANVSAQ